MNLTAEAFLEVLRSLRSDAPQAQMRRRRLPRVGVRLRLLILPMGDDGNSPRPLPRPVTVRLRNLSRRGIGFVHNQPLSPGQAFMMTLPREAGGNVHLLGRVERCRQIDQETWDIGSSIRLDVPREEFEAHLARFRKSA